VSSVDLGFHHSAAKCTAVFNLISFHFILFYFILFYFILFYFILFYFIILFLAYFPHCSISSA